MLYAEDRIDKGFFPSGPGSQCGMIHNDHLATPQKMTDASGTVVWAADYKPFGEATITVSTITNNLRFPGQYYDAETGNHYNYFRDYDPAIGKYKQADPIGLLGGINPFAYVNNNTAIHTDVFGLFEQNVDYLKSKILIDQIWQLAQSKGNFTLDVSDLLGFLNFPKDIAKKINKARGSVSVVCSSSATGKFSNTGDVITENLPNSPIKVKISLRGDVSGDVIISQDRLVLTNLKGINDSKGILSFDLDEIILTPGQRCPVSKLHSKGDDKKA